MAEKPTIVPVSSAPGRYRTAQRRGQSGEQDERRPGPSPLSGHQTGPHAPYADIDIDGSAAIKHGVDGQPAKPKPEADRRR